MVEQEFKEQVVSLLLTLRDYEIVKKMFEVEESPQYSVVKAEEYKGHILVDLYITRIETLWYLAKKVQTIHCYTEINDTKKEA